MLRIYIKKKGDSCGHVFKSKFSIIKDKVVILPFTFVLAGIITLDEWSSSSEENICKKFNIYVSEKEIDGRSKLARNLENFSWYNILSKFKKRNSKTLKV